MTFRIWCLAWAVSVAGVGGNQAASPECQQAQADDDVCPGSAGQAMLQASLSSSHDVLNKITEESETPRSNDTTGSETVNMEVQHPPVPGLSEMCLSAIDSVEELLRTLLSLESKDFSEYDWELLVSPMQQAVEHLKDGAVASADFLVNEFHHRLIGDELGLLFHCDEAENATTGVPTGVDPTDTLLTLLSTVGNNCPEKIVSNNTLSKLSEWVDVQSTVYQCVKSGASPMNTTKDRERIWLEISSVNETVKNNESQGVRFIEENAQTSMWASLSFVCSTEHRLDYLDAMAPGSKALLQQNQCKTEVGSTQLSKTTGSLELKQHALNHADHPLKTAAGSFYKTSPRRRRVSSKIRDEWGWGRRRRRRRTPPVTTHDARKQWKQLKCASEANPDFDAMFANKVHDGCSSPVPVLYKSTVTPTCFMHDMCYACSTSQAKCDKDFKDSMKQECERKVSWGEHFVCQAQAEIMYLAVIIAGKVHGNPPAWCQTPCALAYWENPTTDTFKVVDPWYH